MEFSEVLSNVNAVLSNRKLVKYLRYGVVRILVQAITRFITSGDTGEVMMKFTIICLDFM